MNSKPTGACCTSVCAQCVTDEQIRELRNTKRSIEHWNLCDRALRNQTAWDRVARVQCAAILNRGAEGKS